MKPRQMLKIRKREKDPAVRDRIMLNVLIERDEMSVTEAAHSLNIADSTRVLPVGPGRPFSDLFTCIHDIFVILAISIKLNLDRFPRFPQSEYSLAIVDGLI